MQRGSICMLKYCLDVCQALSDEAAVANLGENGHKSAYRRVPSVNVQCNIQALSLIRLLKLS